MDLTAMVEAEAIDPVLVPARLSELLGAEHASVGFFARAAGLR